MFKLINVVTGKVVAGGIHTEREANRMAAAEAVLLLSDNARGRRLLGWYKGKLPEDVVRMHVMVKEMIGDWIPLHQPEDAPEETTDDFEVVFLVKKGCRRFVGCYDAEEGVFVAQNLDEKYEAEKVIAYMLLPEANEENCC